MPAAPSCWTKKVRPPLTTITACGIAFEDKLKCCCLGWVLGMHLVSAERQSWLQICICGQFKALMLIFKAPHGLGVATTSLCLCTEVTWEGYLQVHPPPEAREAVPSRQPCRTSSWAADRVLPVQRSNPWTKICCLQSGKNNLDNKIKHESGNGGAWVPALGSLHLFAAKAGASSASFGKAAEGRRHREQEDLFLLYFLQGLLESLGHPEVVHGEGLQVNSKLVSIKS